MVPFVIDYDKHNILIVDVMYMKHVAYTKEDQNHDTYMDYRFVVIIRTFTD